VVWSLRFEIGVHPIEGAWPRGVFVVSFGNERFWILRGINWMLKVGVFVSFSHPLRFSFPLQLEKLES